MNGNEDNPLARAIAHAKAASESVDLEYRPISADTYGEISLSREIRNAIRLEVKRTIEEMVRKGILIYKDSQ